MDLRNIPYQMLLCIWVMLWLWRWESKDYNIWEVFRLWVWMYDCGIVPVVLYHCIIQHSRSWTAAKRVHSRSRARLGKHKIETGTAIMFNSKQLDCQIATMRDTKLCKWLQQLCLDSGYEAELEEDPANEDEDGGGGSIDEFDRVDISKGIDGMHAWQGYLRGRGGDGQE